MLLDLFKNKSPVDRDSEVWLDEMFDWCLTYLDADLFHQHSQIILPTDDFFSGRISSEQAFAELVMGNIQKYSHITHWPLHAVNMQTTAPTAITVPPFKSIRQLESVKTADTPTAAPVNSAPANPYQMGGQSVEPIAQANFEPIPLPFNPRQIKHPEALISTMAQQIAQMVMVQVAVAPPGVLRAGAQSEQASKEIQVWASEVIGVFLGFGVMFSNTAFEYRGGCGSCYDASKNRPAQLPQAETLYALAKFCHLKDIPAKQATKHLKPHLRGMLKETMAYLKNKDKNKDA
jgi:hypothetical protein